jgi:hypothetical protein
MGWYDDFGYDISDCEIARYEAYDEAIHMGILDLATFILQNITFSSSTFRDMTENIATKCYNGINLTEKQKNVLYNAYVDIVNNDDYNKVDSKVNKQSSNDELLIIALSKILQSRNTGHYSYNEKEHSLEIINFFKKHKNLL